MMENAHPPERHRRARPAARSRAGQARLGPRRDGRQRRHDPDARPLVRRPPGHRPGGARGGGARGARRSRRRTSRPALWTRGLPELDLLVRTSGEQRISNFLLWQCAYAELALLRACSGPTSATRRSSRPSPTSRAGSAASASPARSATPSAARDGRRWARSIRRTGRTSACASPRRWCSSRWRSGSPSSAACPSRCWPPSPALVAAAELILMFSALGAAEVLGIAVAGAIPLVAAFGQSGALLPEWSGIALAARTLLLFGAALLRRGPLEALPRSVSAVALAWLYCGVLLASVVGLRLRFGVGLGDPLVRGDLGQRHLRLLRRPRRRAAQDGRADLAQEDLGGLRRRRGRLDRGRARRPGWLLPELAARLLRSGWRSCSARAARCSARSATWPSRCSSGRPG